MIKDKLKGDTNIGEAKFNEFWDWFGAGLEKIRHQKHMASLFLSGLVIGFISKSWCENVLNSQEEGSFLIRFSDRNPGRIAIAYVGPGGGHIKHYLVKASDTAGNKKTLVDFLKHIAITRYILQLCPDLCFKKFRKHAALQNYYTEQPDDVEGDGYEEFPSD